ncbi:ribulose-5-phosphate 4-epimerase/fuculose-1-phosphate aldolase [Sphingomonas zeicaulis]|uniref:class II aldolase/adducin family protein n=1 Tax=Sphingomonas zeicaulis TaxID=1632740 RepID=UPI003D20F092
MATAIQIDQPLNSAVTDFVDEFLAQAADIFRGYRAVGTLTANGTVNFIERVPGEDLLVSTSLPHPFDHDKPLSASVVGLDGTVHLGRGANRYLKVFNAQPTITSLSHVHSPNLAAWAQTHRSLPISYVPVQRYHLARELPVYVDRRQDEQDFILDSLAANPFTPAIIEANGGATVWGWKGLRDLAEFILLLEEGADIQIRAQALGGSRPYGPGVLRQQWRMSGRIEEARALNLLPATDLG